MGRKINRRSVTRAVPWRTVVALKLRKALAELRRQKEALEAATFVMVLFGIPVGLYQHAAAIKKEQLDREYATYDALDEKYVRFVELCMAHPDLDIFDVSDDRLSDKLPKPNDGKLFNPDDNKISNSKHKQKKEVIAFTMLFSIFERAHFMYKDETDGFKSNQWDGWNKYIKSFCNRDNFRSAWKVSGDTFDTEFQNYMKDLLPDPLPDESTTDTRSAP